MNNMKIRYITIALLSVLTVIAMLTGRYYNEQHKALENEKRNVVIPREEKFTERIQREDVKKLKATLEKKTNQYLTNVLEEGQYNYDNSAVETFHEMFRAGGDTEIRKTTPSKKVLAYYKQFDVEYTHFGASKIGDTYTVYTVPVIKKNGKVINDFYNYSKFTFDKNLNLTGGKIYGQPQ